MARIEPLLNDTFTLKKKIIVELCRLFHFDEDSTLWNQIRWKASLTLKYKMIQLCWIKWNLDDDSTLWNQVLLLNTLTFTLKQKWFNIVKSSDTFTFSFILKKMMLQLCGIKWHFQVSSLRSKFCGGAHLRCSHLQRTLSKGHFRCWLF